MKNCAGLSIHWVRFGSRIDQCSKASCSYLSTCADQNVKYRRLSVCLRLALVQQGVRCCKCVMLAITHMHNSCQSNLSLPAKSLPKSCHLLCEPILIFSKPPISEATPLPNGDQFPYTYCWISLSFQQYMAMLKIQGCLNRNNFEVFVNKCM